MPKFNLSLNMDQGVAEGYESYSGPLPKSGSYPGILKIVQMGKASERAKNPGAPMLKIGVELTDAEPSEAIGFVAFRNLVLVDSVVPYINQFLRALTDGSDAELAKIQKAFQNGIVLDDQQKNVLRIGPWKIGSPEGQIPVKVAVKQRSFSVTVDGKEELRQSCGIESFLLSDRPSSSNGGADEPVAEEDDDDESVFDLDDDEATV